MLVVYSSLSNKKTTKITICTTFSKSVIFTEHFNLDKNVILDTYKLHPINYNLRI